MRVRITVLLFAILVAVSMASCNRSTSPTPAPTADISSTASIVGTAEAFQNAISSHGTWIICTTKDIAVTSPLVLEGEFKNGKKDAAGNDIIQRKVALYTQDADKNITNKFTLTAPSLTVRSPEASIQHGTFKGDIYVEAKDFQLIDAVVEGNVYFSSADVMSTFKMDDNSHVTGNQSLKTQ